MAIILRDAARKAVAAVPDNSVLMPAAVFGAWQRAGQIALAHFGLPGERAWFKAGQWLTSELEQRGNVRPLLKWRLTGRGWAFATISPVTGYAGLTAPAGI